jgi:AraC-like DNA-binding protein
MPASGSSMFTDVEGYQANLRDMMDLLVPRPRLFHARLTWVELSHLGLLRAEETSPRVAYVALPAERVFVTFPTKRDSPLICDGAALPFGEIMLHGCGDRLHQRTTGASSWGAISMAPATLTTCGRTIADRSLCLPGVRQRLRPAAKDRDFLLGLHAQAGRMAQTALDRFAHKEVVRALEQDLIMALVNCLIARDSDDFVDTGQQEPGISVRFEAMLSAKPYELLRVRDICNGLGITAQVLKDYCSKALGMSAHRYQRLRRLKRVRAEMLRTNTVPGTVVEVLGRYGFADIHRFIAEYWNAYGEMPPIPPRVTE